MNDWWKAPVLQGEDNDYGQYDYLIEEIPKDYARWEFDRKYKWKCDDCGKDRRLRFCTAQYFYTLDGYDSMSWNTCWRCRLKDALRAIKYKVRHSVMGSIETWKTTIEFYKSSKHVNLRDCYKLAYKLSKR